MGRSYAEQSARSSRAFAEVVWPEIAELCGGGEYRSLETGSDPLDTRGGIDGYQLFRSGVRTIAQRTQFVDSYDKPSTFTIRSEVLSGGATELDKRLAALERGYDLPMLTVQSYVWEARGLLIKAGIVHTRPFYEWVARQRRSLERKRNGDDGNGFLVAPWDMVAARGVPIAMKDLLCRTRVNWTGDTWI